MIQPIPHPDPLPEGEGERALRTRGLASAGILIVYLALAVLVFGSVWRSPGTRAIGVGTDPVFFIWYFRWVPFALVHGLNPLLTDYLDFPVGVNLTWNGLSSLPALVLSPVTLTAGGIVAYNLMVTLALALSSWTAFLAIRRYVPSTIGAFFGALLYGFSPAMMARSLGHPQIAMAFIPPLLLLAVDQMVVRQRWHFAWSGLLLGLLGAAQLYSSEELLATEVIVAAAGLALLVTSYRGAIRSHLGYAVRAAGVAAAVFVAIAAPWLIVQFFGPQRIAGGVLQPSGTFVTDLVNFVLPTSQQALAPGPAVYLTERATGNLSEWEGYVGLPLLGLLIFSAIRYRAELMIRLSAVLALLLAILSLGVTLHVAGVVTPIPVAVLVFALRGLRGWVSSKALVWTFLILWTGLAVVPVLRNVLPARLMLFVFLFAGILLAAFLREALGRTDLRRKGLALAIAGLSLLLLVPRLPFPSTELSTPTFFRTSIEAGYVPARSVALVAPYSYGGHADAMLWQAQSGFAFKMPEGYAMIPGPRASPPDSLLGAEMAAVERTGLGTLDQASIDQMRRDLQGWRVQTVIVGPMSHRDDMVRLLMTLLGRDAQSVAGVELWQDVQ